MRKQMNDATAAASAVAVTVVTVALVWARNHRFFYRDDVEHQMMGVFTALHAQGHGLSSVLRFHPSWYLSLIAGEIQFGVFNPFSVVRDSLAVLTDNLAVNATLIAGMYLVIAVLGAYAAARALRVSPGLSVAAALFTTFNVHLLYWDAGSWTPALIGFSWFTWFVASVWWTRRDIRFAPLIPVAGFMLVTAGWPHAMIASGVVALIAGLQQLLEKNWGMREAATYAAACLSTALLSAPTWMTAKVFADWAARAPHGLFNDGFLTHHLDALGFSWSPFSQPYIDGFAGQGFMFEPITYIAWFLPLAAYWIITSEKVRRTVRVDLVVAGIVCVGMFGPSILGPTRWPFRFQPFAAFLVVMAAARAMQTAAGESHDPKRFANAWKWIAPVAWLALTAFRPRLYPMFLSIGLMVAIASAHRLFLSSRRHLFAPALSASVVITTLYLVMASPSPAMPGARNAPESRASIASQYLALNGQRVMILQANLAGSQTIEKKRGRFRLIPNPPGAVTAAEMADGNIILATWSDDRINLPQFITGYSAMPPESLENLLHTTVFGWTTQDTAPALFTREESTGAYWIDLLGVTRLMVQKGDQSTWLQQALPADYQLTVVQETPSWVLYSTPGESNSAPEWRNDDMVVVRVPATPALHVEVNGKRVPFRLLAGVLPAVNAPQGSVVTIGYGLPHGRAISALVALGAIVLLLLCVLSARAFRRDRDARTAPTAPTR